MNLVSGWNRQGAREMGASRMIITGPRKEGKIWVGGFKVYDYLLIGWWAALEIRWCSQESATARFYPSRVGTSILQKSRNKQFITTSLRRSQDLPQGCTTVVLLLYFCIPSLPWLITLNLTCENSGKVNGAEWNLSKNNDRRFTVLGPKCASSIQGMGWWWLWPFPAK